MGPHWLGPHLQLLALVGLWVLRLGVGLRGRDGTRPPPLPPLKAFQPRAKERPPLRASSLNRWGPPVSRPRPPARRPPGRRPPGSRAHEDAAARAIPGSRAGRLMLAPPTAGGGGASGAPPGPPAGPPRGRSPWGSAP